MAGTSTTDGPAIAQESGPALSMWARTGLLLVSAAFMMVDLYLIFLWAPTAEFEGDVQRIFYVHIPLAWIAFLAFFLVLVGSIAYLWKRNPRWDALAHASAEIGVILASIVLVTGIIWAKPVWGVWWAWDPKLTTTLVLWLIYVGYLVLRNYAPSPAQGARYAAVLGIVGFVDVPIVYFAAEWWRGVHPEPVVGPLAVSGSVDTSIYYVLMFSLLTFTLLFACLLWQRLSLRLLEDDARELTYTAQRQGLLED